MSTPASQRSSKMLQVEGEAPENRLKTAAIRRLGKEGNWNAVVRTFSLAQQKDTILYSAAIAAASWCKRHREGLDLFAEMEAAGLKPTAVTYVTVMGLHGRLENEERVQHYFDQLLALEGKPPAIAFMPLMGLRASHGDVAAVEALFGEMATHGLKPDKGHFGNLLKACRQAGEPDRSEQVLADMRACGVEVDVRAYTTVVGALRFSGLAKRDLPEVRKRLERLEAEMQRHGVEPNEYFLEEKVGAYLGMGHRTFHKSSGDVPPGSVELALATIEEVKAKHLNLPRGLQDLEDCLRSLPEAPALPPNWSEFWSEEHRRHYYHNAESGTTQWMRPTA